MFNNLEVDESVTRQAFRFFWASSALAADWIDVALGISPLRIVFMYWNACSADLCEIPNTLNSQG